MKKILVADWLDRYGGAERVLTVLNRQYDFEKCYTLINIMSDNDLEKVFQDKKVQIIESCLLYTSPSPRDATLSRMPSSA